MNVDFNNFKESFGRKLLIHFHLLSLSVFSHVFGRNLQRLAVMFIMFDNLFKVKDGLFQVFVVLFLSIKLTIEITDLKMYFYVQRLEFYEFQKLCESFRQLILFYKILSFLQQRFLRHKTFFKPLFNLNFVYFSYLFGKVFSFLKHLRILLLSLSQHFGIGAVLLLCLIYSSIPRGHRTLLRIIQYTYGRQILLFVGISLHIVYLILTTPVLRSPCWISLVLTSESLLVALRSLIYCIELLHI
jgi:hypothetical protein